MIIEKPNVTFSPELQRETIRARLRRWRTPSRVLLWLLLLTSCVGTGWFSYQYFLVPQTIDYTPDWHNAQWIQAADGDSTNSVAYFHYVIQLDTQPDTAFITIAANQAFLLYVNGSYIGSNSVDFVQGDAIRAYMYDVDSVLKTGPNVIAVRVMNVDQQPPALRANLGVLWGKTVANHGTGERGWQASVQSSRVYPRYTAKSGNWTTPQFDASTWQPPRGASTPSTIAPMLTVDPMTYEQPLPPFWLKAGAGDDSYFVRQFSITGGFSEVLLRLTATGTTDVFINGQQFAEWKGQVATAQDNVVSYLSDGTPVVQYRAGLAMGVYDLTPYLHAGTNTIALHLASPGLSASQVGLATEGSALGFDLLARWSPTHTGTVVSSDQNWHASSQATASWTQVNATALAWPSANLIGRPGNSRAFYLPDSNTSRNVSALSPLLFVEVIGGSVLAVLALWSFLALALLRPYYTSRRASFEAASLAFVPALALEALLMTLARETQLPNPFPYTGPWGLVLIALVVLSGILLWLHAYRASVRQYVLDRQPVQRTSGEGWWRSAEGVVPSRTRQLALSFMQKTRLWLSRHWLLIPIMLLAIPMIVYNVNYEPYWQDELSSLNAAKGILAHGIPIYISGFLYPKGEGYSYLLALFMVIFGDQNGITRLPSMLEFIISIPLFYGIGCYFFDRRIALLATAMLAFSPYALLWGRQTRMYEQAFLLTLIVIYVLHYALQNYQRPRLAYLTILAIILAYLSHEETFIILPAVVVCVLLFSPKDRFGVPEVLKQKHWWYTMLIGVAVIGVQLIIVGLSHPAKLGSDQSQRPEIQPTLDNIPYYLGLFFNSKVLREGIAPWIIVQPIWAVNSILAIIGGILAFRQPGNMKARYCTLMFILPLMTLAFIFTMQADRYVYPLFSMYYLLDAFALMWIFRTLWNFARPYLITPGAKAENGQAMSQSSPGLLSRAGLPTTAGTTPAFSSVSWIGRTIIIVAISAVCASVIIQPILPLSNFNLLFSRVTGMSYHRHFPDYDDAGQYIKSRWQKGDIVATIAPDLSAAYYLNGHAEYFFSLDRSLYLFDKNGHIIDTALGSNAILSESDFQTLLAEHFRVWLITDNGSYQASAVKGGRFTFPPPDFQLVYEGYGSAVYFRGAT